MWLFRRWEARLVLRSDSKYNTRQFASQIRTTGTSARQGGIDCFRRARVVRLEIRTTGYRLGASLEAKIALG